MPAKVKAAKAPAVSGQRDQVGPGSEGNVPAGGPLLEVLQVGESGVCGVPEEVRGQDADVIQGCRGPGKDGIGFCGRKTKCRGLCPIHYDHWRKGHVLKPVGIFAPVVKELYDPAAHAAPAIEQVEEEQTQPIGLGPVPQSVTCEGSWASEDLIDMRDAVKLPFHSEEPPGRTSMRKWMDRNIGDFTTKRLQLEAELRARVDRAEEEEAAAAKNAEERKAAGQTMEAVADLGAVRVRELSRRLLESWNQTKEIVNES